MEQAISVGQLIVSICGLGGLIIAGWVRMEIKVTRQNAIIEYLEKDLGRHAENHRAITDKIDVLFKRISEIKELIASNMHSKNANNGNR